jgi:hypothetical protein
MKRPQRRPVEALAPSPHTRFEMQIRADARLNVTGRLLWLLVVLSARRGYTFIAASAMTRQLNTPAA